MIEETATVIAADDKQIWVESTPNSGCSSCSSRSCGTSVIAKLFGNKRTRLQLENSLDAKVGEQVVLGIPDALLVKASISAYMLPLLAMILAAATGNVLGVSEGMQVCFALIGLVAGLWLVSHLGRNPASAQNFKPALLRIAPRLQGEVSVVHFTKQI